MKELLVEFVLDSDPFFNEKCLNISHCLASVFSVPFLPEEMRTMETILALRGVLPYLLQPYHPRRVAVTFSIHALSQTNDTNTFWPVSSV